MLPIVLDRTVTPSYISGHYHNLVDSRMIVPHSGSVMNSVPLGSESGGVQSSQNFSSVEI